MYNPAIVNNMWWCFLNNLLMLASYKAAQGQMSIVVNCSVL